MKKLLIFATLPLVMLAKPVDLKTLISHAKHNDLAQAQSMNIHAKAREADAAESAYAPTLDIGLSLQSHSPVTAQSPGKTGAAFVRASMNLFDGGRKADTIAAKRDEYQAALFERQAFERSTALKVVRQFFTVKKVRANLTALYQRAHELQAQLDRVRKLKEAGMATASMVDKLKAAYEDNRYRIANTKLGIESATENLKLLSGMNVHSLARNYIREPHHVRFRLFGATRAMQAQAHAIGKNAEAIASAYSPQVNASYTYTRTEFSDLAPHVPSASMPDHSHTFQINVGMRLYDGGAMARKSEAVQYQKMALMAKVRHAIKEQKMNDRLARKRLHAVQTQIASARSALHAARSSYETVKKKYEAGVVDNVTYLDALSQRTMAQARYEATRYDYEIAKAVYYFYAGQALTRTIR
jgi:outer membrane protein TolC